LLDTSNLQGGDIAVRLAVAETQVIQENTDYFKQHGVDINALESVHSKQHANKRSNTTLLVKNLPPDSVIEELESMFAR
jgi:multiple RNA-binding domain-containing protein 1